MTAHARQQQPAPDSLNRRTALAVTWHTRQDDHHPDVQAARELLEALGIIHPGGRQLLPDDTRILAELHDAGDSGGQPRAPVREPRRSSSPPGLYAPQDRRAG